MRCPLRHSLARKGLCTDKKRERKLMRVSSKGNRMALASRKDLMRIVTQPAQRKGLHHNLIDLLIDPLDCMHLLNEKRHEKVL